VVGRPSASSAHPSGRSFPAAAAMMMRPSAAALVAMSSTMGPKGLGAPIASGFVPNKASWLPHGAMRGEEFVVTSAIQLSAAATSA
jgi:hypothetical protein